MTDAISDEMVEAAAKALFAVEWNDLAGSTWEKADEGEKPYWRQSARAALAAAEPLIVARERERAAMIAENQPLHRKRIAAAIRAGNGGE